MTKHVKLLRDAGGHKSGDTITVGDGAAQHLIDAGYGEATKGKGSGKSGGKVTGDEGQGNGSDGGSTEQPQPYDGVNVPDLKAEIDSRNEDRDDDATHIKPEGTKREHLVAALVADDARDSTDSE